MPVTNPEADVLAASERVSILNWRKCARWLTESASKCSMNRNGRDGRPQHKEQESSMARPLSARRAEAMWTQLREHFVNAQAAIKQIIDTQAWLPLGYDTFAEAWAARMGDVTLATECRPHVVYQMLAEGVAPDDVALNAKGVGPETVRELDRQRKNGVPADHAVVRRHMRRRPSAPDTLHLRVGVATLREYHRVAAAAGISVEDVATEAVREAFASLVAQQSSRRARKAS